MTFPGSNCDGIAPGLQSQWTESMAKEQAERQEAMYRSAVGPGLAICQPQAAGFGMTLKLCKDCKHYKAAASFYGGSIFPGLFYMEALCQHPNLSKEVIDYIKGEHRWLNMGCKFNRGNEEACGNSGKLFDPIAFE